MNLRQLPAVVSGLIQCQIHLSDTSKVGWIHSPVSPALLSHLKITRCCNSWNHVWFESNPPLLYSFVKYLTQQMTQDDTRINNSLSMTAGHMQHVFAGSVSPH